MCVTICYIGIYMQAFIKYHFVLLYGRDFPAGADPGGGGGRGGLSPTFWNPVSAPVFNNFNSVSYGLQADSGGPLAVKEDGVFKVVGLVSYGYRCAGGYPGVFNRVGNYVDWVAATIAK